MRLSRTRTFLVIALVVAGVGISIALGISGRAKKIRIVEDVPLLQSDGRQFNDESIGLRLTAPENWAMQAVATGSAPSTRAERLVVKYKRVLPGVPAAWLTVTVSDASAESPAEYLRKRRPPESKWTVSKNLEEGLTIAGRPAARITFGGQLDPDSLGVKRCTAEVVAVRVDKRDVVITGTYVANDQSAQREIRACIESFSFR